jgi:hypothetical protein
MIARLPIVALLVALLQAGMSAQQPAPTQKAAPPATKPTPEQPPSKPAPEPPRQSINVRIEVTISDQRGKVPTMRKTITAVTGDSLNARIRTTAEFQGIGGFPNTPIPLNVDAMPAILPNGRIRVTVGLEYSLPVLTEEPAAAGPRLLRTSIQENISVNLEDGKPLVVAQSADPVSDRQVTVEVRATILK